MPALARTAPRKPRVKSNVDENVKEAVWRAVKRNYDVASTEVYNKLKPKHPRAFRGMTIPTFHARYVLPAKRRWLREHF
jgi:hypothetical protein